MDYESLSRGEVINFTENGLMGFVRDEELQQQLYFYYKDGRFMGEPYRNGEPSFSQGTTTRVDGREFELRLPRAGDWIAYQRIATGGLIIVARWTYASHYDSLRLRGPEQQ